MPIIFGDFDATDFWEPSDYALQAYVDDPLAPAALAAVEKQLGYSLPKSYVELALLQNGGVPRKTCHRTTAPTSWAHDHVAITGILGIGHKRTYSLCGEVGSRFMIEEWGYPQIGVYFADCPSAGHDMLCLDYRNCGRSGEPQVVHVDQECDYTITFVAESFEKFIRGLESEAVFDAT